MDKQKLKLYLNSFAGRMTGQDVVILGALRPEGGTISSPEEADVEIYMSHVSMKILHAHLSKALETYENLFGEIKIQPSREALLTVQKSQPDLKLRFQEEPNGK